MLKQILIIDDSDPDLLYTRIVLESAAIAEEVLPLETAADALAYLCRREGHDVDVILLDINMPEMDGFEFLEHYERLHVDHMAHAVVVMLTSSPDPRDRARAMAYSSVKGYVVKPLDRLDAKGLVDLVNSLIAKPEL
jgi:CheY-like chemotaxis protein